MIRIVGTVDKTQKQVECWLMAGDNQTTVQWIMALYDQFGLYGRPGCLLKDPEHTKSLNFGDNKHALFLETNEVIQKMKASPMSSDQIESMLIEMMVEQSSRMSSTRAQSLPAITIDTPEEPVEGQQEKTAYPFSRQIADSSDESSSGEEEEDDDDRERNKSIDLPTEETLTESSISKKSPVNELIPDFDFGNGFDVPKSVMAAVSANRQQTLPTRGSRQRRTRYRSSMALFSEPFEGPHQRKSSMPIESVTSRDGFSDFFQTSSVSSVSSSCTPHLTTSEPSLFGDFNLGGEGDFNKFLQEPLDYHRKFSLTFSSAELTSPSVTSSHDWEVSELAGPMIPPLGDHFAPQNSLLDTYLGDQLSAKEQIEYAKATGQPLIQVSKKETGTKGGLVGVISQREKDRKEGTGYRVAERVHQHHAQQDRFEKEKERRLLEQRQQQFMKHQMLLYANGYNAMSPMAMIHPQNYVNPMMSPPATSNMVMLPQYTPSSSSSTVHPYNLSPTCMPPTRNMTHRPFYGPSPPNCPPTGYYGGSLVPNFNIPSTMFSQGRKASQSTSD
ncbi:hypothetical protein A0J61_11221 [Choanephora cucurbitarum]|uniref:Skg3/CAF120-like PH-like domain-containing protein n=1 Tax=Choanephora cucurbitarum TaxID=101091 RepID=A0A1C7MV75_9FUNG|nr:hypothetical protein A0J61_11221 [Choanephora cucurbitarum]